MLQNICGTSTSHHLYKTNAPDMLIKSMGKNPDGKELQRIKKSENYKGGQFQNQVPTEVTRKNASYVKMMKDFINKPKSTIPPGIIPSVTTDLHQLQTNKPVVIWFGHSSYLIRYLDKTILVDPVLKGQASPVSFFGRPFKGTAIYQVADLPPVDAVIITHDHYDHLDFATISELKSGQAKFYTPLGVGSHLAYWGVQPEYITELDWWEHLRVDEHMQLTATPARHFSGRALVRNKTLWASFVLNLYDFTIMIGGDSGYGAHFKEIGASYGPFDLAILEAGQYGDDWPFIHMLPEETVQAAIDLQAATLLPVHWGKFTLAFHPWNEPVQRVVNYANKINMPVIIPRIGKPILLDMPIVEDNWWKI